MLELYHWEPNGLFLKPLIALHEKDARFTSHYFDASRLEQLDEGFPGNVESRLHLEREGPVLVDGDEIITSTFFMLEYINDSLPGIDLKPGGAFEHYRMQAWGQKIATILSPAVCALGCATYLSIDESLRSRIDAIEPLERRNLWLDVLNGRYDASAVAGMREHLKGTIGLMETTLNQDPWLAGEEYSIADIDAFAMIRPLPQLAPDVVNSDETPALLAFIERVSQRPAVATAMSAARTEHPETCFVPGCEASRWG